MSTTLVPKDLRRWVRAAVKQGWTLTKTKTGHQLLTSPDGEYSTPVPGTSTNRSLMKAIVKRLRRHGVEL